MYACMHVCMNILLLDRLGCVNIFISEGANVDQIVKEMEGKNGETEKACAGDDTDNNTADNTNTTSTSADADTADHIPRDAFGHVKLDAINPGKWFASRFASKLHAEKVLIQKSGYFARSAAPCEEDHILIKLFCHKAVECGLLGISGCVGQDSERGGELRAVEFERICGDRRFDVDDTRNIWFSDMMDEIYTRFP